MGSREPRSLSLLIAAWLAATQISIAASQILLTGVILWWLWRRLRGSAPQEPSGLSWILGLFAILSLASASTSLAPAASLAESKKLLLLLVPLAIIGTLRQRSTMFALTLVALVVADLSAAVGIWQFFIAQSGSLQHRIQGFVGHYMTYSGLVMTSAVVALSGVLFAKTHKLFFSGSLLMILMSLVLTLTRNAWLGMVVAAIVLLAIKNRRLVLLVPVVAGAIFLIQPDAVRYRVESFLRPDASGLDRLVMVRTGMKMVAQHPWLGVGTDMVAPLYPIYVEPDALRKDNPHLHNNAMQIAAERGVPGLMVWIGLLGLIAAVSVRELRHAKDAQSRMFSATALGVLVAGIVAGMFEYNFGDSEYQMLFWFLVSFPFILSRERLGLEERHAK